MKKLFFVFSLTLFFALGLFLPKDTLAVTCCPVSGTTTVIEYDEKTNTCTLITDMGTFSSPSSCTASQICNSSGQCEDYTEPETIPAGCSNDPNGREFCIVLNGQNLYCSTDSECENYIEGDYSPSSNISTDDYSSDILCGNEEGISTAIGCIPIGNTDSFIAFILNWAFGIGGGIAFLLIVLASFQIMTSGGDPKKLQAGKELLTSAISGLLLLIFSVFILRVIGVNILGLGEFGFGQSIQ